MSLPILAVLLLAAALRILGANGYPVWTDEGWSIQASSDPTQVIPTVAADRHPPLYFAALSLWRRAAGDSHIALRFLSIGAGLLTVAVAYRVGADWFGRRAGLLAALLLAALPAAVYYAQEVRHYGWLTLFSALSWLLLLRCLRSPRRAPWPGYMASITAMLYTLYFGALTVAAQVLVALVWRFVPSRLSRNVPLGGLMAAWLAAALLYLPWAYVMVTQQAGILSSGISGFPGTISAGAIWSVAQITFGVHAAITLAAFVIGTWAVARQPTVQRVSVVIGGGGLLAAMVALSLRFDFLAARTLVFVTPLVMVVGGYGLSRPGRIGTALAGVWVALTLFTPTDIQPRLRTDMAARALASAYQPGDAVILETGWDDNAFAYEIGLALTPGAAITPTLPWTNDRTGGAPVVPRVEPILQAHRRVWVVQWLQAAQVMPFLEAGGDGYQLAETLDVSAGEYGERFAAPTIQIRLFERVDGGL